jgi:hypothetical protein
MARESRPPASRPDLGVFSLPLADGRVVLSSAPDATSPAPRLYVMTRRIKYSKIVGATGFEPVTPRS